MSTDHQVSGLTMKLIQKIWLKGTFEYELIDEEVHVRIKTPLQKKTKVVELAILNPEPVVNAPFLEFHSRVKCGPLLSLYIDKPDKASFASFVTAVKAGAQKSFNDFAGINHT